MAAYARRFSLCGTDWPYRSEYERCPVCAESDTWICSGAEPLTHSEAQQIITKHRAEYQRLETQEREMDKAFDEWFCRKHGIVDPSVYLANRSHGAPLDELFS